VGGILTSRIGTDGTYNMAYGVDGIFRLFGDDYLDVRLAQTQESDLDHKTFSADPTFFGITWERRNDQGFAYDLSYTFTGEHMNPEMGFLRRNDVQGMNARLEYGWLPDENSKIFRSSPRFQIRRYNRLSDGQLESMEVSPGWFFMTKKGFGAFLETKYMREGVEEVFSLSDEVEVLAGEYGFMSFESRIFTPSSKPIYFMSRLEAGQFYDGKIFSIELSPIFNFSSSIQLSGSYEFNAVGFPVRDQHLKSHIARFNALYMHSTKLSISTFVQYNNANDAFIGNLRIRYNPREGNDFYLVFNEYRGFIYEEVFPPEPSYYRRALLLKYTHTFRL
jgi:hypothetical protein